MAKSSDRANYCKNKPVLFICHSGYKSQQQALHYAINGFMQVYYTQVNL